MPVQLSPVYDQYMIDIVNYIYSQGNFSAYAFHRARLVILDSLGCAIETVTQSPECRALLGPVVPSSTVPRGCRTPGTAFVSDPVKASFDLGTLIRYLDHNDGFTGQEWGHPSDMLGAILSVAEWQTRTALSTQAKDVSHTGLRWTRRQPEPGAVVTIGHILEATIKAFEVHCVFQLSDSLNRHGIDHTLLVKIGAVSAITWLMGMSREHCLAALSQVFQDGGMLRTYRQAPNTGPRKGWAAGDACMRAVHLALLTRAGQPGAPTVLTDPKWGFYAVMLGGREFTPQKYGSFAIENNGFKLVAAEGHGISACNAALIVARSLEASGVSVKNISKIDIRTMRAAITIIDKKGPLRNAADRDHCLRYMIAVTLLKGALPEVEDYADDSVFAKSSEIERLRESMHAYEDPKLTSDYFNPAKRTLAAGLTVTLSGAQTLAEVLVETPLGHAGHPDTNAAVLVKFRKNIALAFEPIIADRAILALENNDLPVSVLIDHFWKGSQEGHAPKL